MHANVEKNSSQTDWHPADIVAALHKQGITLRGLARQHGLKDSSGLSAALVRSLPTNEKRIATALGLHPKEIWPSRYHEDGTRKPQGFHAIRQNRSSEALKDDSNEE